MLDLQTLAALNKFWEDKLRSGKAASRIRKARTPTYICGKCGRDRDPNFDFCRACGSERIVRKTLATPRKACPVKRPPKRV